MKIYATRGMPEPAAWRTWTIRARTPDGKVMTVHYRAISAASALARCRADGLKPEGQPLAA